MTKLNEELAALIDSQGNHPVEVVHPVTNQTFYVVAGQFYEEALEALRLQRQQADHDAIARGVAEMEAGGGIPLEEARQNTLDRLVISKPSMTCGMDEIHAA